MSKAEILIQVHDSEFNIRLSVDGEESLIVDHQELNAVNGDVEINRDWFADVQGVGNGTIVRLHACPGNAWSGRIVYFGPIAFCPRCDIDPKDCGEHS